MTRHHRIPMTVLFLLALASVLPAQRFAVATGDWNGPIWAAASDGAAGSAAVPTMTDSITVNAGVIVTVRQTDAQCHSVAFGDAAAKLALDTGSVLTVYGNFTLATTAHNAIASWAPQARLVLAGGGVQLMKGWSTSGFSTSFNYLRVDKTAGKVVTDGTNMRFGIGDTLEIVRGTFELASTDDIESRSSSGSATSFVLLVQPEGSFTMTGSTSHIRRASNTSLEAKRVGRAVVYGSATLRSTSTNGLNFAGIDVNDGGELVAASFSNSAVGNLNAGAVTVKSGGELRIISTAPFWDTTSASVTLQAGGVYRINGDPGNAFPRTFVNGGTVRYGATGDQTVKDMPYHRLEISFAGTKTWTVDTNRVIAESLEVNNSAVLRFAASSPKTVTLNGTLRLTSGSVNNHDSNQVTLALSDTADISRATGTLAAAPQFGASVNLRYTSSVQTVTPGPEMPSSASVLGTLALNAPMGLSLSAPVTVNKELNLTEGLLYLNDHRLTLGPAAAVTGTPADSAMVVPSGTGTMRKTFASASSFTFPLGDTLAGRRYTPAALTFTSGTFAPAQVDLSVTPQKHPGNTSTGSYLARYWTVAATGLSAFSAAVSFDYDTSDIAGTESALVLGQWTGSGWASAQGAADTNLHRLNGTVTSFSDFTGGELKGVTGVTAPPSVPAVFALRQNYPNPFNPSTVIAYDLPAASTVSLAVYDILGKEVAVLVNGEQPAGRYSVSLSSARYGMASGLYFYRIAAAGGGRRFIQVNKMMLVK